MSFEENNVIKTSFIALRNPPEFPLKFKYQNFRDICQIFPRMTIQVLQICGNPPDMAAYLYLRMQRHLRSAAEYNVPPLTEHF